MSDPRAIAQVTTAASALQGAGVTMDVSAASLFAVGQLVELYPSQYGDGAPLARAGQTVRYQITAIAGAQLTGTLNTDLYANPPQVERGWIIDGRATGTGGTAVGSGSLLVTLDDVNYARNRIGLTQAFAAVGAAGGGEVYVPPGSDINWDSSVVTISIGAPGVVTWPGHGLDANYSTLVLDTTGAMPIDNTTATVPPNQPLVDGGQYYPVNITGNSFSLAASRNGPPITLSGGQSGVHTAVGTADYTASRCYLNWHPSVRLNKTADAISYTPIRFTGVGFVGGTSQSLTADAPEGIPFLTVNAALLLAGGLVRGDIVVVRQDLTDTVHADAGSDAYCTRVYSSDTAGGFVFPVDPPPKSFTFVAQHALIFKLSCGVSNRVTGLYGYGNGNTGLGGLLMVFYQDNFSYDNLRGLDINGPVFYIPDYCYATEHGSINAVRCGNSTGINAVETVHADGSKMTGAWRADDCQFGLEVKGSSWSNWVGGEQALSAAKRAIKFHHVRHCNISGLVGNNSQGNSGLTLSGDSAKNNLLNLQAAGNFEGGFLMVQIPGGTNVVRDNQVSFYNGINNNRQTAPTELNINIGALNGPNNHFSKLNVGGTTKILDSGFGNSFGSDHQWDIPWTMSGAPDFTAGAGTWTVEDPDQTEYYTQEGKEMEVFGSISTSSTSGAPNSLMRLLPNTRTAAKESTGVCTINENGTLRPGIVRTAPGDPKVYFFRGDGLAFAGPFVNTLGIYYRIKVEVQ